MAGACGSVHGCLVVPDTGIFEPFALIHAESAFLAFRKRNGNQREKRVGPRKEMKEENFTGSRLHY